MSDSQYFRIDDFSIHQDDRQVSWHNSAELPPISSGTREGTILIELDVDGQMDLVTARISARPSTSRPSSKPWGALQQLHGWALAVHPDGLRWVGRCTAQGNWGRCLSPDGHDGQHRPPH